MAGLQEQLEIKFEQLKKGIDEYRSQLPTGWQVPQFRLPNATPASGGTLRPDARGESGDVGANHLGAVSIRSASAAEEHAMTQDSGSGETMPTWKGSGIVTPRKARPTKYSKKSKKEK